MKYLTDEDSARIKGFDLGLAVEFAYGYHQGFAEGNDEDLYPEEENGTRLPEVIRWVRRRGYDAGVSAYCDTIDD